MNLYDLAHKVRLGAVAVQFEINGLKGVRVD